VKGKTAFPARQAVPVKTMSEAIEIAKNCSSLWDVIGCQNHLNEWGYRTMVDHLKVSGAEDQLRGLHLFLCHLSHQIANEKTFEVVQYGETFKLTSRHI
jgi:hypothetical protein